MNSKHYRDFAALLTVAASFCAPVLQAQEVPPRFYLKSLAGGSAVPVIYKSMSGNTNPFDPSHIIDPEGQVEASMTILGYASTFSLWDRSALVAVVIPVGRVSGTFDVGGITDTQASSGFGDPMVEFDINLLGPAAQKTIPDAIRYEPGLSIDLLADLAFPIGEYNNDQALNLGQNRWYGRLGFPINWQLGSWVPGRRTTLEFLPAAWVFGDNDDFTGHVLTTEPMYRFDAHVTHDFTDTMWGALDASWYMGAKASVDGVSGEEVDSTAVGVTLGYTLNDNLNLTLSYMSTIGDDEPGEMSLDGLMISFVYGWHPIIEGSKRLGHE